MDKEKEIKEIAEKIYERGVALSPLDFVYGAHGDDHFTRIAKYLSDNGYGNVQQTAKDIYKRIKRLFDSESISEETRITLGVILGDIAANYNFEVEE